MRNRTILVLLILAVGAIAARAMAGCENDLMLACSLENPNQAFVAEPLDFSKPFQMNKVMGVYVIDRGVNFFADDFGRYELGSARMQQISCSPGLVGGDYFGAGKQGFLDMSAASPHRHINWGVAGAGTYLFEFKITNAKDPSGTSLQDSPVFVMVFNAQREYALVDTRTAYRMPNGAKVEIGDLQFNTGADFDGYAYAQSPDRCAGLRVVPVGEAVLGDMFSGKGRLSSSGGERVLVIEQQTAKPAQSAPTPLLMATKSLGDCGEPINTPATDGRIGIRTSGLLVKVWGTLQYDMLGGAYIDDGARVVQDPEVPGIRVDLEGLTAPFPLPAPGSRISITGISGVEEGMDGGFRAVVRPRKADDVRAVDAF